MTQLAVTNHSTVVSPADLTDWIEAQNIQCQRDVYPAWRTWTSLFDATKYQATPVMDKLWIMDDSDQAGALGYHEIDPATGRPWLKVFAGTTINAGLKWQVTAGHETIENGYDPFCYACVDIGGDTEVAAELGDPVEGDRFGYTIKVSSGAEVPMTDFVLPAYYDATVAGSLDFTGHVARQLEILPGGYLAVKKNGQWSQTTNRNDPTVSTHRADNASRIKRRQARLAAELELTLA